MLLNCSVSREVGALNFTICVLSTLVDLPARREVICLISAIISRYWFDSMLRQLPANQVTNPSLRLNNRHLTVDQRNDISQFLITSRCRRNKIHFFLLNHSRQTQNKLIDSLAYKDLSCFFFLLFSHSAPKPVFEKRQIFCRCLIAFHFMSRKCNNIACMCEKRRKKFAQVEYSTLKPRSSCFCLIFIAFQSREFSLLVPK